MTALRILLLIAACAAPVSAVAQDARAGDFKVEDVPMLANVPVAQLKPRTVAFAEYVKDKLSDPSTGLIPFDDWARERPLQRRFLSLFPEFSEPSFKDGGKRKLSIYVAEARFRLSKPSVDLARYANIAFIERLDPAVKHQKITAAQAMPNKEAELTYSLPLNRKWCEDSKALCLQSRYKFEGRIPSGILLVNKLRDENKKPIPDYIEFQSELRLLAPQQPELAEIRSLTGIDTPVVGAIEQSSFWANQVIQFGKLLAVVQQHPTDRNASIASVYLVLAVRNDILNKQKEYGNAPVLRNMVPAQLLMGNSSFNTGDSISAGLPKYARGRIKAMAEIIEKE
jgi:hypothetical protein